MNAKIKGQLNANKNVIKIGFCGLIAEYHCVNAAQKQLPKRSRVLRSYVFPEDVALAKIITVRRFALISVHEEASS